MSQPGGRDAVHWESNRGAVRWMARLIAPLSAVVVLLAILLALLLPWGSRIANAVGPITVLLPVLAYGFLTSQPLRVGFSKEEWLIVWAYRTDRVRPADIERLTVSVSAREMGKPQDDRLFTAVARLADGRQQRLGNLMGSIAVPMILILSPSKSELWVRARDGAHKYELEERGT